MLIQDPASTEWLLEGAMVIADQYHQDRWGLQPIDGARLVVESRDDLEGAAFGELDVVVVDSRPDVLTATIDWLADRGAPGAGREVRALVPEEALSTALHLMRYDPPRALALAGMRLAWGYLELRLVPAGVDARASGDLLSGIDLGRLIALEGNYSAQSPLTDDASEVRSKLLNVLCLLETFAFQPSSSERDSRGTEVASGDSDRAALEGRVTTLTVQLAALQRKYDALASSRLGRITLANWERKKSRS